MGRYRGAYGTLSLFILIVPPILACSLIGELPGFADGCYLGTAKAWIDENANGLWDTDEKPLPGVSFSLTDGKSDRDYLYEAVSKEKGEFFLSIFPNTCKSLKGYTLTLRATPPQGYQATTSSEIVIPQDELLDTDMHDYSFGFLLEGSKE
jgi:hypothetical protein